jgi:ferric-dicitrate binding protein FerR (iron transport regulator)
LRRNKAERRQREAAAGWRPSRSTAELSSYTGAHTTLVHSGPILEECTQAYQAWRAAESEARRVERQLAAAWEQFSGRKGFAPPSDELMAAVSRLRAEANDKLTIAMLAISAARGERPIA